MELPFETDTLDFLAACAVAFRPLPALPAAKEVQPAMQTEALPSGRTLWQRFPGGNAVIKQPESPSVGAYELTSLTPQAKNSAGFSVEALSRAVERDARRFDANA